jgi:hypothetical protein
LRKCQGTYQCGKLPNPRKGGELGIVDLSTRGYELHLQNGPLGEFSYQTVLEMEDDLAQRKMPIHFHPLDAKPLTTLEQESKLSAH